MPVELQLALKARQLGKLANPVARLYRSVAKEIPRVLTIYDIDMPEVEARKAVRAHFAKNAHIKDDRVLDMLVEKGYMDLEETLLQHKQRSHLLRTLDGYVDQSGANRKILGKDATFDEVFNRI
mmetsp:Transcript_12391/g.17292  ORF Transcript_12391/g.17292 Transcript_12391/m.17292 type:complete len:124 (-) Transcript_12391:278-649(-)